VVGIEVEVVVDGEVRVRVEEYTRLKSKIDCLHKQKIRAEGALEQAEKRLSGELGVPAAEADDRIAALEERVERMRRRVDQRLEAFSKKWNEKLEEV